MPAAWRLATNSLQGRRLRTALLVGAVALSAGLIVAVSCGVASLNAALAERIANTIGVADARITRAGDSAFDDDILNQVQSWTGIASILPRTAGPITLTDGETESIAVASGVDLTTEFQSRPLRLLAGRPPESANEIAIEVRLAEEFDLSVGDSVGIVSFFGGPPEMTVVGVIEKNPFWALARPHATLAGSTLGDIVGAPGKLRTIDLILDRDIDPLAFVSQHKDELGPSMLLQATERITSGIDQNIRSQQIGLLILSMLGFIAAAFIILTGLTTNVVERQRELAIVRCIGGSRMQIALAQVAVGAIVGVLGAACGVPFGIAVAWVGVLVFEEHLQAGLVIPPLGVSLAATGAIVTGCIGAAWPAMLASRVSPLEALSARARKPSFIAVIVAGAAGLALIVGQQIVIRTAPSGDLLFWTYVAGGVQAMFVGYFLLGAPIVLLVGRFAGAGLARLMRVPPPLLRGVVTATPFRHGMTSASLMVGLSMMIVIWTSGGAVVKQWLGAIEFPDAFVHGWLGMTPEDRERIDELPFVDGTNAVTILEVDDGGAFGVSGVHNLGTTFVGFEPESFFEMTKLAWIEGDPDVARDRLAQGGAVLVAQEFYVARGLGVSDSITLTLNDEDRTFEIAGVIASPGLEIASRYFDIGKLYRNQAISAVFGTRDDLQREFGVDEIHLVQIDLSDEISDEEAIAALRKLFAGTTVSVGSGREIKGTITFLANGTFAVVSSVAIAAILIACLGVGNVIIASVEARRFEFGVLRAVGAEASLLTRFVLSEALVMALAACVLGSLLGIQGAWNELRLYRELAGMDLTLEVRPLPILFGCLTVIIFALGAAAPPAWRLSKRHTRELLMSSD